VSRLQVDTMLAKAGLTIVIERMRVHYSGAAAIMEKLGVLP
jgi:hypothetical protein